MKPGTCFGAAAAVVLLVVSAAAATDPAGFSRIGFDVLAGYKFTLASEAQSDNGATYSAEAWAQIPGSVRQLEGRKAIVTGFMLPVKLQDGTGLVTDFLLVRDPMMCCYGMIPDANDWVVVHMANPVPSTMDVPISFAGVLHVGPVYDNGYLTGIYRLDGQARASDPPKS